MRDTQVTECHGIAPAGPDDFHLLPGVDDGPADMDASLELAGEAVADGSSTVVGTPHVRADLGLTDPVEIHARVLQLRGAQAAAGIPLEVRCGAELGHELVAGMRRAVADRTTRRGRLQRRLGADAEGLIAVVASDAHGPTRPPALSLARRTLLEVGVRRRAAAALVGSTPHRLMALGIPSRRAVAA